MMTSQENTDPTSKGYAGDVNPTKGQLHPAARQFIDLLPFLAGEFSKEFPDQPDKAKMWSLAFSEFIKRRTTVTPNIQPHKE